MAVFHVGEFVIDQPHLTVYDAPAKDARTVRLSRGSCLRVDEVVRDDDGRGTWWKVSDASGTVGFIFDSTQGHFLPSGAGGEGAEARGQSDWSPLRDAKAQRKAGHASQRSPTAFGKRVRGGAFAAAFLGFGGSFLGLIPTQAATGRENTQTLVTYFLVVFVGSYGIGAATTLTPVLLMDGAKGQRVYIRVVLAFALTAAATALLCAMVIEALVIFVAVPLILMPAAAGWMASESAIRRLEL